MISKKKSIELRLLFLKAFDAMTTAKEETEEANLLSDEINEKIENIKSEIENVMDMIKKA